MALRWVILAALIITGLAGVVMFVLNICLGIAIPGWVIVFILAAGIVALVALGTYAVLIWLGVCHAPCGWAYLMSWQVTLGVALGILYLASCCGLWMWGVGLALLGAAGAAFWKWQAECDVSACKAAAEFLIVLTVVVVVDIFAFINSIPPLAACANSVVQWLAVGALTVVTGKVASCVGD